MTDDKPMRTIVVTGASRGLGLGVATRLASTGYRVVAVARREGDALARARELVAHAKLGELDFVPCDLSDIDALPELVRRIRAEFGSLYGLVNNAGIGTEGLLAMMHNSQIEMLIRLNTLSPIVLTKYVVRQMMADHGGRVVNISSIIASTGYTGLSVYGATKA